MSTTHIPTEHILWTDIAHVSVNASAHEMRLIKHDDTRYALAFGDEVYVYIDAAGAHTLAALLAEVNQ